MATRRSNILTAVLIIVFLLIAYVWYSYYQSKPASQVRSVSGVSDKVASKELLALLNILQAAKIDLSFFQDPLFLGLEEPPALPPVSTPAGGGGISPSGRANPFLPF